MIRFARPNLLLLPLLLGCTFNACRKAEIHPDLTTHVIDEGKALKSVYFLNPMVGFVSGGEFETEGFIYRTMDGAHSWERVFTSGWSINDICFLDDSTGLACGDSLHIIKTVDRGEAWFDLELAWYPYDEHVVPLKHIEIADDTTWYFTGGRYYQYGINIRTQNGGGWLDNMVFQVELNTSWFRDGSYGLLGGYGTIINTPDANVSFKPTSFSGDNITSLSFNGPENGLACGYNGGIYSTHDGGNSWTTVLEPNGYIGGRKHFNSLDQGPAGALAVGNDGAAFYSGDGGESWSKIGAGTDDNFNDVQFIDGAFLIVTGDGTLLKLRI